MALPVLLTAPAVELAGASVEDTLPVPTLVLRLRLPEATIGQVRQWFGAFWQERVQQKMEEVETDFQSTAAYRHWHTLDSNLRQSKQAYQEARQQREGLECQLALAVEYTYEQAQTVEEKLAKARQEEQLLKQRLDLLGDRFGALTVARRDAENELVARKDRARQALLSEIEAEIPEVLRTALSSEKLLAVVALRHVLEGLVAGDRGAYGSILHTALFPPPPNLTADAAPATVSAGPGLFRVEPPAAFRQLGIFSGQFNSPEAARAAALQKWGIRGLERPDLIVVKKVSLPSKPDGIKESQPAA